MNNKFYAFSLAALTLGGLKAQDSTGLQQLDEVVVSDSRFTLKRSQSGKTVIRIDSEELRKNPGKPLPELLNALSGIEIAGSRGRPGETLGVFARGGRGRQVLVIIDGVRVNDPSTFSQEYDLRLLSTDAIESVEIIKGAASTLYGSNAATAVINITTRKPGESRLNGEFQSSVGSNQTAVNQQYQLSEFNNSARLGGQSGKWSYQGGFSQTFADGISSLTTSGGEEDPFSSYRTQFEIGYRFAPNSSLRAFGNLSDMRTAYDEAFGGSDAPYTFETRQKRIGISSETAAGPGQLILNAAFTEFESEDISSFPGIFKGQNLAADLYYKYPISGKLYALAGFNYLQDKADMENWEEYEILDPYLNLVILSGNGWQFNGGLRLNTHSEYGEHLVYSVNPSYVLPTQLGYLKFMASYASSYITPSLTQLFGAFGANPDLQPETNRTLESGIEWKHSQKFRTSILYFNREEENYVFFRNDDFRYDNAEEMIRVQGLEVEALWLPLNSLRVRANYTYTDRDGDNAIRIPRHKANANFEFSLGKHSFASLRYSFTGNRPDTDFNTFEDINLDAFSLLGISLSHGIIPEKLRVFLDAENLLNEKYTEIIGFNTRGRNLRIGLQLTL